MAQSLRILLLLVLVCGLVWVLGYTQGREAGLSAGYCGGPWAKVRE